MTAEQSALGARLGIEGALLVGLQAVHDTPESIRHYFETIDETSRTRMHSRMAGHPLDCQLRNVYLARRLLFAHAYELRAAFTRRDDLQKLMVRDRWLDASECIQLGIVDAIACVSSDCTHRA